MTRARIVLGHPSLHRPRISRETRRLLWAAALSLLTLWILARVRFPDRAPSPVPVPPLLTQLAIGPSFEDLALEVAQLRSRIGPTLLTLPARDRLGSPDAASREVLPALRVRDDIALARLPAAPHEHDDGSKMIAHDPASGLTLFQVPSDVVSLSPVTWSPQRLDLPRFLMTTAVSSVGVTLRPVFVGSLHPIANAVWPGPVWAVPAGTGLDDGAFVFNSGGELVGLVTAVGGGVAIVSGEALLLAAQQLLVAPPSSGGRVGVDVQSLTPPLAKLSGAEAGVVVTWVDPEGPARDVLAPGDIIETANGHPMATAAAWNALAARLAPDEAIALRIRRKREVTSVKVVADAPSTTNSRNALGLTMRAVAGTGSEVLSVEPRSAAGVAHLEVGDVITLADDVPAPTPLQVRSAFAATPPGQPLMLAITRNGTHLIVTLDR